MTARLAYIEEVFMGDKRPMRYSASFASILFPGYADRFANTWADRRGARNAAKRSGMTVVKGVNPLPRTPSKVVEEYRADVEARRVAREACA